MRVMAIDYGDAHTGVALSDATGLLAGYTTVIRSREPETVAAELARLAKEHGVEELVLGFPRNMDGTEGPRAEKCRAFAGAVEAACGLRPVLWDERRTTVEAHAILHAGGRFIGGDRRRPEDEAAQEERGRRRGVPDPGGVSDLQAQQGLRASAARGNTMRQGGDIP